MTRKGLPKFAAASAVVLAVLHGPTAAAADDLTSELTETTEQIVPSILPSLPLPTESPLGVGDGDVGGGISVPPLGDPAPVGNGSGGSGGSGESGGSEGSGGSNGSSAGDGAATSGSAGETADAGGAKVPAGEDAQDSGGVARESGSRGTLTGSVGSLAANIGRLAGPLGIPLGLALVAAAILVIATRRPVALRKVEEEGTWGYEGRSHRL